MSSNRLCFAVSLMFLALIAASPAMAAPENPSLALGLRVDFLVEMPPCQAAEQSRAVEKPALSELPVLTPKPVQRVIYMTCGNACSDGRCYGQATGSSCSINGAPGYCKAANQSCPNEQWKSPCTCQLYSGAILD